MSHREIQREWDAIAYERLHDLLKGTDISYEYILKPNMLAAIMRHKHVRLLDAGCGVGVLTKEIASIAEKVVAIDLSRESIRLAALYNKAKNIDYEISSIESYSSKINFDMVISNMVLMDTPEVSNIIKKIYKLLNKGGVFIFTITHPAFWPLYWGYNKDEGFDYSKDYEVRKEFSTRLKTYDNLYTRHYHRPLEYYLNMLISSGFTLEKFTELSDGETNHHWYPRFVLFECIKR